jgi:hypothetical protein
VTLIDEKGNIKIIGAGRWWLSQEERRQYERVAYDPGNTDPATFNLWRGFSCEPVKSDCGLYLDHLLQNVCGGNKEHFTYLLNWMSRAVQQPGTQGEVAVVLRGKEGTGKGIAIGQFGKLFGTHFLQVSQPRHLVGNFNGPLQSVSLLFADEAFFAGDRSHEGVLKALVTEPTLQIEIKGVEPITAKNALHTMMSSNSDWVVPAGADARRFFCLNVGDGRKQDTGYFDPIVRQMDNGGRAALLHELLARDLKGFNVRRVPATDMLRDQQSYSRRGVDALAYILADSGELPCALREFPHIAMTAGESKGEGFIPEAHRLVPDLKRMASSTIKKELRDKYGCKHYRSNGQNGIIFPELGKLRAQFPKQDHWGEGDVWAAPPAEPSAYGLVRGR